MHQLSLTLALGSELLLLMRSHLIYLSAYFIYLPYVRIHLPDPPMQISMYPPSFHVLLGCIYLFIITFLFSRDFCVLSHILFDRLLSKRHLVRSVYGKCLVPGI